MSRRRTISDEEILGAAARVMARLGPSQYTLADVAAEVGLAPATLLQRFGSKRGLLLALTKAAADGADECLKQVRGAHRSPIKALLASVDMMAGLAENVDVLANNLGFLQMDLADAEFRKYTRVQQLGMLKGYERLLEEAIDVGELMPCDTAGLARLVASVVHGSMVAWGFYQEGTVVDWMRRDVELLLEPYRLRKGKRKKG